MFLWDDPPRVVGHRGAPRLARENTLDAFRACVEAGVPAFELDARLSADGHVVVHHDAELGRVLPGEGEVAALELATLRRAGVPTLAEVLAAFPDALVDLELKADAPNTLDLPEAACRVVDEAGARDRVIATSFDPGTADAYARHADRPAGLIVPYAPDAEDLSDWPRLTWLAVAHDAFTPEALMLGRRVMVWTVDDEAEARGFLDMGVAGVVTDRPERLGRALS